MQLTVDLRSDTVTKPTPGMMDAMMSAKVGDDVFGEDGAKNCRYFWYGSRDILPVGYDDQPGSY
jgi:hypothetical protein